MWTVHILCKISLTPFKQKLIFLFRVFQPNSALCNCYFPTKFCLTVPSFSLILFQPLAKANYHQGFPKLCTHYRFHVTALNSLSYKFHVQSYGGHLPTLLLNSTNKIFMWYLWTNKICPPKSSCSLCHHFYPLLRHEHSE